MAKGKNKTGPRNPDGSPKRQPKQSYCEHGGAAEHSSKFAFNNGQRGNLDKRTSNVTSQQAIEQLLKEGFEIKRLEQGETYRPTQKKGRDWMRQKFNIDDAAVSNTGNSLVMIHPNSDIEVTIPIGGNNLGHKVVASIEGTVNSLIGRKP